MYGAKNVCRLLISHGQELPLGDLVEIRKQNTFEEAEEPEPETKDRTMTAAQLAESH
jgi:hypothetical protein